MTGLGVLAAQGAARVVADPAPADRRRAVRARRADLATAREVPARDHQGGRRRPVPDRGRSRRRCIADAVDQLWKNLAQFGAFAAIILAMGSVSGELDRGTAAFVLSKTATRGAFLAAKVGRDRRRARALDAAGRRARLVLHGRSCSSRRRSPAGSRSPALAWLGLCAWAAITFLGSAVTGSTAAAAGIGFAALLVLSIVVGDPERLAVRPGRTGRAGDRAGRGLAGRSGRRAGPGRLDASPSSPSPWPSRPGRSAGARSSRRSAASDDPGRPQRGDLGRDVAELREDLVRVLAEQRRRRSGSTPASPTARTGCRPGG